MKRKQIIYKGETFHVHLSRNGMSWEWNPPSRKLPANDTQKERLEPPRSWHPRNRHGMSGRIQSFSIPA